MSSPTEHGCTSVPCSLAAMVDVDTAAAGKSC